MEKLQKNIVLLGIIGGIVFLLSHNLSGWGWLVFLFILTLLTTEDGGVKTKEDEEID